MDKRSLESIEIEMAILIRRFTSMTTEKKFGNLDRSAYLLLHQISLHGSAGVKALADEFHLDISTVSRQVTALEQKGYVTRMPDPTDRRASSFQITSSGTQELQAARQARIIRIEELLQDWSDEERDMFGQLLRKFNDIFK